MTDVVDSDTRSRMMSGIKAKNTQPELLVRKALFSKGLRYKLHDKSLPGKPDLVFPKYRSAVFINGCFWHGHDCHLFKLPSTRPECWKEKITRDKSKDADAGRVLKEDGWNVIIVWECALKGKDRIELSEIVDRIEFAMGSGYSETIAGRPQL